MRVRLRLSAAALFVVFAAGSAQAAPIIFFGENQNPGEAVSGAPVTAHNAFLAGLTGVGTEEFEGFALAATEPLVLTFPGSSGSIGATLSGAGQISVNALSGRFNTSPGGAQFWEVSGAFQLDFSAPISAFGFYGTDIGDFTGQVTVSLWDAVTSAITNVTINNTINGKDGSLLFWGFIDSGATYDRIVFGNTAAGTDFFGFDSMTIGDAQQIRNPVPEPATVALLGLGLGGVVAVRRRRVS